MKKIIVIEYEPGGSTDSCYACPFHKQEACQYLERIGLDCENVRLNDVSIKEESQ